MHNEAFSKTVYAVLAELLYFGRNFPQKCKICVLVSAYIDAHPAEGTNIIYVFLRLDIVDNYFSCTMK